MTSTPLSVFDQVVEKVKSEIQRSEFSLKEIDFIRNSLENIRSERGSFHGLKKKDLAKLVAKELSSTDLALCNDPVLDSEPDNVHVPQLIISKLPSTQVQDSNNNELPQLGSKDALDHQYEPVTIAAEKLESCGDSQLLASNLKEVKSGYGDINSSSTPCWNKYESHWCADDQISTEIAPSKRQRKRHNEVIVPERDDPFEVVPSSDSLKSKNSCTHLSTDCSDTSVSISVSSEKSVKSKSDTVSPVLPENFIVLPSNKYLLPSEGTSPNYMTGRVLIKDIVSYILTESRSLDPSYWEVISILCALLKADPKNGFDRFKSPDSLLEEVKQNLRHNRNFQKLIGNVSTITTHNSISTGALYVPESIQKCDHTNEETEPDNDFLSKCNFVNANRSLTSSAESGSIVSDSYQNMSKTTTSEPRRAGSEDAPNPNEPHYLDKIWPRQTLNSESRPKDTKEISRKIQGHDPGLPPGFETFPQHSFSYATTTQRGASEKLAAYSTSIIQSEVSSLKSVSSSLSQSKMKRGLSDWESFESSSSVCKEASTDASSNLDSLPLLQRRPSVEARSCFQCSSSLVQDQGKLEQMTCGHFLHQSCAKFNSPGCPDNCANRSPSDASKVLDLEEWCTVNPKKAVHVKPTPEETTKKGSQKKKTKKGKSYEKEGSDSTSNIQSVTVQNSSSDNQAKSGKSNIDSRNTNQVACAGEKMVSTSSAWKQVQVPTTFERDNSTECPICYYELDKAPNIELVCKHLFHKHCVQKWFKIQGKSCPICRKFGMTPNEYPPIK